MGYTLHAELAGDAGPRGGLGPVEPVEVLVNRGFTKFGVYRKFGHGDKRPYHEGKGQVSEGMLHAACARWKTSVQRGYSWCGSSQGHLAHESPVHKGLTCKKADTCFPPKKPGLASHLPDCKTDICKPDLSPCTESSTKGAHHSVE